jgi:sulfite oxidase
MMVSGQDLDAFWSIYDLHKQRPHILKLLEKYRIGTLSAQDASISEKSSEFHNAYTQDPKRPRKAELHIPSEHPWNHEPPLGALVSNFLTPNDLFFVRNHNAVPELDEEDWEIEIVGDEKCGMKTKSFTVGSKCNNLPPSIQVLSAVLSLSALES